MEQHAIQPGFSRVRVHVTLVVDDGERGTVW